MSQILVQFTFHPGVSRQLFRNVRLSGSWNANGFFSNQWSVLPMTAFQDETGCSAFSASVALDETLTGSMLMWGVIADIAGAPNSWVVATEVPDQNSNQRYRSFVLYPASVDQAYWLATGRRFGARRYFSPGSAVPALQFSLWAPHARSVEVVFGLPSGYISDDGNGIDPTAQVIPLSSRPDGIWQSDPCQTPVL